MNDKVHQFVFQHCLCVEVGDEERDVITLFRKTYQRPILHTLHQPEASHTLTGFLRRMKKLSARCVKNLMNLWTRMCSISSACLILMLTLIELMLVSIKTFSFSFLAMISGFSMTSGVRPASISGTLCRSAVCEAKLLREMAAVREERTHFRYGRSDWDYLTALAYCASGKGVLACGIGSHLNLPLW